MNDTVRHHLERLLEDPHAASAPARLACVELETADRLWEPESGTVLDGRRGAERVRGVVVRRCGHPLHDGRAAIVLCTRGVCHIRVAAGEGRVHVGDQLAYAERWVPVGRELQELESRWRLLDPDPDAREYAVALRPGPTWEPTRQELERGVTVVATVVPLPRVEDAGRWSYVTRRRDHQGYAAGELLRQRVAALERSWNEDDEPRARAAFEG